MNLIRLTELLIYTYGAFCYGAILLLWGREMGQVNYAGRAARPSAPRDGSCLVVGSITLVSLLWFVTNLLIVLAELQPGMRMWPLRSILLTLAFLFPPLIAHTTFVEICADAPGQVRPLWRRLLPPFYGASLVCILVSMLGFYGILDLPAARWAGPRAWRWESCSAWRGCTASAPSRATPRARAAHRSAPCAAPGWCSSRSSS